MACGFLIEVSENLGRSDEKSVTKGLEGLLNSCQCPIKPCFIEQFIARSPQCMELFRAWALVDSRIAPSLPNLELPTSTITNSLDKKQNVKLISLIAEALALVLEHGSVEFRSIVVRRILTSCRKSLYGMLQYNEDEVSLAASRLLVALQDPTTDTGKSMLVYFIHNFNFDHPGFRRLGMIMGTTNQKIKRKLQNGEDLLSLELLGQTYNQSRIKKLKRRGNFIELFCKLLNSGDAEITLKVMEIRNYLSQITRYLSSDSSKVAISFLKAFKLHLIENDNLTPAQKSYICRPALISDLTVLAAVYESLMKEGEEFADTGDDSFSESVTKSFSVLYDILRKICSSGEVFIAKYNANSIAQACVSVPALYLPRLQNLVLEILSRNPEVSNEVLERLAANPFSSPQPRLTFLWISQASFVKKILELQPQDFAQYNVREIDESKDLKSRDSMLSILQQSIRFDSEIPEFSDEKSNFWNLRLKKIQTLDEQEKRLMQRLLAGGHHIITRANLTACLTHKNHNIVFIGLTLIKQICNLLNHWKYSAENHDKKLERNIASRLPELDSLLKVLVSFDKEGNWIDSIRITEIPFDTNDKVIPPESVQMSDNEILEDDVILPGLHDIEIIHNTQNVSTSSPMKEKKFSLIKLLKNFDDIVSKDLFTSFLKSLSIDPLHSKFNWTKFLTFCHLKKKSPSQNFERALSACRVLEVAWNFDSLPLEMKLAKYHSALIDQVLQLLHHSQNHFTVELRMMLKSLSLRLLQQTSLFVSESNIFDKKIVSWLQSGGEKHNEEGIIAIVIAVIKNLLSYPEHFLPPVDHLSPFITAIFRHWMVKPIIPARVVHLQIPDWIVKPDNAAESCKLLIDLIKINTHISQKESIQLLALEGEWRDIFSNKQNLNNEEHKKIEKIINKKRKSLIKFEIYNEDFHDETYRQKRNLNPTTNTIESLIPVKKYKQKNKISSFNLNMIFKNYEYHDIVHCLQNISDIKLQKDDLKNSLNIVTENLNTQKPDILIFCEEQYNTNILAVLSMLGNYSELSCIKEAVEFYHAVYSQLEDINKLIYEEVIGRIDLILLACLTLIKLRDKFESLEIKISEKKNKSWSMRKKRIPSLINIIESFFLTPLIESQFQLYFLSNKNSEIRNSVSHKNISVLNDAQMGLIQHLTLISILKTQLMNSKDPEVTLSPLTWLPSDWIDKLTTIYTGSLSTTDRQLRMFLQDPPSLIDTPSSEWDTSIYDFREIELLMTESSLKEKSSHDEEWIMSRSFNWLNLNKTRLDVTLEFFDFQQNFSLDIKSKSPEQLFQDLTIFPTVITDITIAQIYNLRNFAHVPNSNKALHQLSYDICNLLPFVTSRLRAAWLIIDERRRKLQGRPAGPLYHLLEGEEPSETLINFSYSLEGDWLRSLAGGGVLQLLILGLSCEVSFLPFFVYPQDFILRSAAFDALALLRSLLVAGEDDAQYDAAKKRRQRVWKLALRALKTEAKKSAKKLGIQRKFEFSEAEIRDEYDKLITGEGLVVYHCFKEWREIMTLLELLKNSILNEASSLVPSAVPALITSFLCCLVPIVLDAAHPLYSVVNRYLSSRCVLPLDDCPLLLHRLLRSTSAEAATAETRLALSVWRIAARSADTWKPLQQKLSLFLCIASDMNSWSSAISVLITLATRPDVTVTLVQRYCLLDWIDQQLWFILRTIRRSERRELSRQEHKRLEVAVRMQLEAITYLLNLVTEQLKTQSEQKHHVDAENLIERLSDAPDEDHIAKQKALLGDFYNAHWRRARTLHTYANYIATTNPLEKLIANCAQEREADI